jgi:hypothetical protein
VARVFRAVNKGSSDILTDAEKVPNFHIESLSILQAVCLEQGAQNIESVKRTPKCLLQRSEEDVVA